MKFPILVNGVFDQALPYLYCFLSLRFPTVPLRKDPLNLYLGFLCYRFKDPNICRKASELPQHLIIMGLHLDDNFS